jgi:hypothetical protein
MLFVRGGQGGRRGADKKNDRVTGRWGDRENRRTNDWAKGRMDERARRGETGGVRRREGNVIRGTKGERKIEK